MADGKTPDFAACTKRSWRCVKPRAASVVNSWWWLPSSISLQASCRGDSDVIDRVAIVADTVSGPTNLLPVELVGDANVVWSRVEPSDDRRPGDGGGIAGLGWRDCPPAYTACVLKLAVRPHCGWMSLVNTSPLFDRRWYWSDTGVSFESLSVQLDDRHSELDARRSGAIIGSEIGASASPLTTADVLDRKLPACWRIRSKLDVSALPTVCVRSANFPRNAASATNGMLCCFFGFESSAVGCWPLPVEDMPVKNSLMLPWPSVLAPDVASSRCCCGATGLASGTASWSTGTTIFFGCGDVAPNFIGRLGTSSEYWGRPTTDVAGWVSSPGGALSMDRVPIVASKDAVAAPAPAADLPRDCCVSRDLYPLSSLIWCSLWLPALVDLSVLSVSILPPPPPLPAVAAPVADDDESMDVVVTGSPDRLRLVESEISVGTLSKLFSAAARAAWVVSATRVVPGCAELTAGVCWRCVPRGMIVAMPYRSRRLLAGLPSPAPPPLGRELWWPAAVGGVSTGGFSGDLGMTVSSDPGAVRLVAAWTVVAVWRTSCSARSTECTCTPLGDGATRYRRRGETDESADDQVDWRRASVQGDIVLHQQH